MVCEWNQVESETSQSWPSGLGLMELVKFYLITTPITILSDFPTAPSTNDSSRQGRPGEVIKGSRSARYPLADPSFLFIMSFPQDDRKSASSLSNDTSRGNHAGAYVISAEEEASHIGVKRVEATHKVYGKYSKWALFIGFV